MRSVIRYILPVLFAFAVVTSSCTGRRGKAEHRNIIPENDLILILTDTYLADGLLSLPEFNYKYIVGDTLASYIDIIKGYGYTKEQMDRTIRYYFIKKPKQLIKIYDKVLGKLSEMESRVDKELPFAGSRELNIWPGKSVYSYPDHSSENMNSLDFPVSFKGVLNLKFTITIFPDDQSTNPSPGLFFSHIDSAGNEKRVFFSKFPYLKDGHPRTYNFRLNQNFPDPVRLKGWFINHEGMSPYRDMHFRVENIIMMRY